MSDSAFGIEQKVEMKEACYYDISVFFATTMSALDGRNGLILVMEKSISGTRTLADD